MKRLAPRERYIASAALTYLLLALAWILVSDPLLALLVEPQAMLRLSLAKGLLFVLATAVMFFVAMRGVPPPAVDAQQRQLVAVDDVDPRLPAWVGHCLAVALTGVALGLRLAVPVPPTEQPLFVVFVLPVVLSALLGGMAPGITATLLSTLASAWLVWPPGQMLATMSSADQLRLLVLLGSGLAISAITGALRRSRQRLAGQRRLLAAVIEGTSDAVFVKDLQGRYTLANQAVADFVGRTVKQVLGHHDRELFPQSSAVVIDELDRAVLSGGVSRTHEERLTLPGGDERVFLVTKGPVRDAAGRVSGLFGISRDITERERIAAALREREQQLDRVIEGADVGYWDWDLRTRAFVVSARFETMLGHAPGTSDLRIERWPDWVHPDDLAAVQRSIEDHLAGRTPAHAVELRLKTAAGDWRWVLTQGRIVERAADGTPLRMAGTHTDVTERKANELALREAATVFDSAYEGIMVVSPDMRVLKINPAFTRITGYAADEVIGRSPQVLASGRHDRAFYAEMRRTLQRQGSWRGELWNRHRDGTVFPELLSITEVRGADGALAHYVGVFSDISQIKAHEAELDRIAHYDPLTGLPNRRLLGDRIRQAVTHAHRVGRSVAVCFLDLDGFKAVNDQHGHAVGDRLLVDVTAQLGRTLRADDTLARLGGDEFVLLLTDLRSTDECRQVLDRVLAGIAQPIEIGPVDGGAGLRVALTASIGVSLYPQDDADADTLLRHADQAMYRAKEAGKNRYQLFDPDTDRQAQAHRQRLARLQQALERGEFELHYQPKVDLANGALRGAEGLIRWRDPDRDPELGLVPPGEFLPAVEGSGLEHALGDWVIAAGLAQAEAWHDAGLTLTVSVNVGANQLLQPDFADRLAAALARHPRLPRSAFELEVLESAAIADTTQAVAVMVRCRTLGVRFALDDFGTGYSSLTYLRRLPIDALKIDQSFVRRMLDDAEDCGIVEGVIRLATALGREVIAEGVETAAHGERLLALGCRCGQGYGIARPMPAAQLSDWAASRRSA